MNVATRVQIGESVLASGVWLRVHRCLGAIAGLCEVTVPAPIEVAAGLDAPVSAAVGSRGKASEVFSGRHDANEARGSYTVFRALDIRVRAAATRVNHLYEEQTSDAIIRALAARAAIIPGTLAPGVSLLSYFADDGRNVLQHIEHLAELGGAHLSVSVSGTLETIRYAPSAPRATLHYGRHLLAVGAELRRAGGPVEVRTEGAAATAGLRAAFWPTTDTASVAGHVELRAGAQERLFFPELRTMASAVAVAATQALRRSQRSRRVRVRCLGHADAELGDTLALRGVPGTASMQLLRMLAIEHRVNPHEGFISELVLEGVQ